MESFVCLFKKAKTLLVEWKALIWQTYRGPNKTKRKIWNPENFAPGGGVRNGRWNLDSYVCPIKGNPVLDEAESWNLANLYRNRPNQREKSETQKILPQGRKWGMDNAILTYTGKYIKVTRFKQQEYLGRTNSSTFPTQVIYLKCLNLI
jgi:hypothetical protein